MSRDSRDGWRRGPRSPEDLETSCEVAWPGLSSGIRKPRPSAPPARRNPDDPDPPPDLKQPTTPSADGSSAYGTVGLLFDDPDDFPRLGQKLSKRKLSPSATQSSATNQERIPDPFCRQDERSVAKRTKKLRSGDVICIDFKPVMKSERTRSERRISVNEPPIRFKGNSSLRDPLDSLLELKLRHRRMRIDGLLEKSTSKMKRLIYRERESKRHSNRRRREFFELDRAEAAAKDLNEMGFDRLRISPDAGEPETTFVKALSAMTLFESGHRKPPSMIEPLDDFFESKDAVAKRFEDLTIRKEEQDEDEEEEGEPRDPETAAKNAYALFDPVIVAKTLCLKICDETGENIAEPDSLDRGQPPAAESATESKRHSRRFREYCTNDLTLGLNVAMEIFLAEIYRLQRRMYEKNEVKGRYRRRFYAGLKEVLKHVESKKIRFVVIAPDLEATPGEPEGLDACVKQLIAACKSREIVFCFALSKRKLGYFTHKKGIVSCVGVTNYSGLEERFKDVLTELMLARNSYGRGNPLRDQSESRDLEDELLSTRINLLFRALAIAS